MNVVNCLAFVLALSLAARVEARQAGSTPGLEIIPLDYECTTELLEEKNMPPVGSQSIGHCDPDTAAVLLEATICKVERKDCTKLSNSERFSRLDLVRMNQPSTSTNPKRKDFNKITYGQGGGTPSIIISNLLATTKQAATEACAPYDMFISKTGSIEEQQQFGIKMWERLEAAYNLHKQKLDSCGAECAAYYAQTTAREFQDNPEYKGGPVDVLSAFAATTYQEFLSRLLVPASCLKSEETQITFNPRGLQLQTWPAKDSDASLKNGFKKIETNLRKHQIMIAQGICIDTTNSADSCKSHHHVVINGYCEKMCNKSGDCKTAVKIQNSWGQSWQDAKRNNKGWVEATPLLERTNLKGSRNSLAWFEDLK